MSIGQTIIERLDSIEDKLALLLDRKRHHYTVAEFAKLVGRSEYTVRQWCNEGTIKAHKQSQPNATRKIWMIPSSEFDRVERIKGEA